MIAPLDVCLSRSAVRMNQASPSGWRARPAVLDWVAVFLGLLALALFAAAVASPAFASTDAASSAAASSAANLPEAAAPVAGVLAASPPSSSLTSPAGSSDTAKESGKDTARDTVTDTMTPTPGPKRADAPGPERLDEESQEDQTDPMPKRPAEVHAQRFSLEHAHIWRGQRVPIVIDRTEVEADASLRVHQVLLITAPARARMGLVTPPPKLKSGQPLDLSQTSTLSPDRGTLFVQLPRSAPTGPLSWTFLDTLRHGQARGVLCIYYAEPGPTASTSDVLCPAAPAGLHVAALQVRVSQRSVAALWGGAGILITLILLHWVLLPYWGKGQQTVLGQHQSGLWLPKQMLLSMMSLTLTPTGSFSLSMAQILWWTLITGFGLTYVWAMTEQFLAITDQVLLLMGIGSTTAIISRVTSNNRTFLPDRYLGLVQARARLPRLSDLVTIDGKPSIFKFQMLLFTALSGIMVLQGLFTSCAFPALPGELVTLMGISSATYVGNELAQRDIWEQIQEKVKAIEAYARLQRIPLVSRRDVQRLKDQPDISSALDELESLLKQVFGDDPAMQAQAMNIPPTSEKVGEKGAEKSAEKAPPLASRAPEASSPDAEAIHEGDRRDPA